MRSALWMALLLLFAVSLANAANPRVYITDSQSWQVSAGTGGVDGTFGGSGSGGARGQTAELVKTFNERCPNAIINNRRERADYVVIFDHEGGKSGINRDNKIAVFNQQTGDAVFSRSTRSLGNAVKDSCSAIFHDWSRHEAVGASNREMEESGSAQPLDVSATSGKTRLQLNSNPAGADIEIDGAFVGQTPSILHLTPGEHQVVVRKNGYGAWQRKVKIVGGETTLNAELVRN